MMMTFDRMNQLSEEELSAAPPRLQGAHARYVATQLSLEVAEAGMRAAKLNRDEAQENYYRELARWRA